MPSHFRVKELRHFPRYPTQVEAHTVFHRRHIQFCGHGVYMHYWGAIVNSLFVFNFPALVSRAKSTWEPCGRGHVGLTARVTFGRSGNLSGHLYRVSSSIPSEIRDVDWSPNARAPQESRTTRRQSRSISRVGMFGDESRSNIAAAAATPIKGDATAAEFKQLIGGKVPGVPMVN